MALEIVVQPALMQARVAELRQEGAHIGLVPTMGYLHEGHLSLMRQLRPLVDQLVVSLFVNPTQFGPGEDLAIYPVDLARDHALCAGIPVDLLFQPAVNTIYPEGYASYVVFERHAEKLCGNKRPAHFRGVGTVVLKLLQICQPHLAAFGRKDAQQLFLIKQMVRDFHLPVGIVEGETVRETDGVAMSSRNSYLQGKERQQARALSLTLQRMQQAITTGEGDTARLLELGRAKLLDFPGFVLEYLSCLNWETLTELTSIEYPLLIAVAGSVGKTRLIDNTILATSDEATTNAIALINP
ncbi:MAG: pantoate--beta-alanine ligase [Candidatus Delongbacteria bacterium]|nr:pantoate--beta-alanine ligase [Candidatus Delongbacteria bacterium]